MTPAPTIETVELGDLVDLGPLVELMRSRSVEVSGEDLAAGLERALRDVLGNQQLALVLGPKRFVPRADLVRVARVPTIRVVPKDT
jgi:hypothetical protein